MVHPLVTQLRFARSEFRRGLEPVSVADGAKRFEPMNSIGWIVGHMAWHEQSYWLVRAQNRGVLLELVQVANGAPASTPPLDTMWQAWQTVIEAVDPYLDGLTTESLQGFMMIDGKPRRESIGSMVRRVTYHYWYHLGEGMAIRQMLGHGKLPDFVGNIHSEAPYAPE
jgi:hypothetical protein